ncbi:hypothetical protein [Salmonirosea aquatica]|uniref:CUB domain-containing protein n=1 Tax=Salmonirosea aquatica TaxID=2654236 RepID=A0A7C9BES2_9BACT|nr:hypothetical protein [Cytophagaceae bacterium SJW1-29]
MKRNLTSSLFALLLIMILQPGCNVNSVDRNPNEKNAQKSDKNARTLSCGGYFDGSYSGNGYYIYPSIALDFSGACNGGTVSVSFSAEDVPNRFTIRDQNSNVVVQSGLNQGHNGYIGSASNSGPWGGPFSGGGSETVTFIYDSSKSYTLNVETSTSGVTDHWTSTVGCTTNCPIVDPVVCGVPCGQYFDGNYGGSGFYIYPAIALSFPGVCNGKIVFIAVFAEDVPNRFTVRDQFGTAVAQSGQGQGHNGFIGTTSDYGPWGSPFSTGAGQETLSFVYDSSKTYTLNVETSTSSVTDHWSANKSCN